MAKNNPFKAKKIYYLPEEDAKIRYNGIKRVGDLVYHDFKVVGHEELDEYSTMDGSEVWENKRTYLSYLKSLPVKDTSIEEAPEEEDAPQVPCAS